jgi:hypothetical protein
MTSVVESISTKTVTLTAADVEAIPSSEAGQPEGVATLNSAGKLPEVQLPSSVATSSADPAAEGQLAVAAGTASNAIAWQSKPAFDIRDYGAVADGMTDCAEPTRKAIKAAEAFINATGRGAAVQLPAGVLAWVVPASEVPVYHHTSEDLGVAISPALAGRLTIEGVAGENGTTIKLTGCNNAFYANTTGANIHANTVIGESQVTVESVPEGAIVVGSPIVGENIPGSTVIAAYNESTKKITLGKALEPSTPVNATGSGSKLGLVAYGLDLFENITFRNFTIDNNNRTGRCSLVFGNRFGENRVEYFKSFENITCERVGAKNIPFDPTETLATTNKDLLGLIGNHDPADVYSESLTTTTKNIKILECSMENGQSGVRIASFVSETFGAVRHFYDKIIVKGWRHEVNNQTGGYYNNTVQATSVHICGTGYGEDYLVEDFYINGIGDDGIEIGAMQWGLIENGHIKNCWYEGIMVRNTQDPGGGTNPAGRDAQVATIRDVVIEANATAMKGTGKPQLGAFAFDCDGPNAKGHGYEGSKYLATGFGKIRMEDVTYKLTECSYTGMSRIESEMGINVYGPIRRCEQVGCSVILDGCTLEASSTTSLTCFGSKLEPAEINSSSAPTHSPAVHFIRDCEVVASNGAVKGTGNFFLYGVTPVGAGVLDVNGLRMQVNEWTHASTGELNKGLARIGAGGYYSLIRLKRLGGISVNSTSGQAWGINFEGSGSWSQTLSRVVIDECDFTKWTVIGSEFRDLTFNTPPGLLNQFLEIGPSNFWNRDSKGRPYGGHVETEESMELTPAHTSVAVNLAKKEAITIKLPNVLYRPWGPEFPVAVQDVSNEAATYNITVERSVVSQTFIDGSASKKITTNSGAIKTYGTHNGEWAFAAGAI